MNRLQAHYRNFKSIEPDTPHCFMIEGSSFVRIEQMQAVMDFVNKLTKPNRFMFEQWGGAVYDHQSEDGDRLMYISLDDTMAIQFKLMFGEFIVEGKDILD
jgi:hypothetical protein